MKTGLQAVLVIGGVILGMKLVSTLATIYAVGKGFIAIMANPIVLAGLGILIAMGMQGLGKSEKQVIEDLENMGGFSKENRDKLIEKYKEDRKNLNPLEFGKRSELTEKIRFLDEGKYGYGKGTKFFDFENLEELTELSDVDKLMLNFDPNYDPTLGMTKNKKE